ncbi:PhnB protein [Andreprevotia lacus DSM 23236]|jgi:PhnB protein|uniref:PhnB protein n=1 Tax=Andreprevotia lacus DSM 23236 TaxID=1121001 RepID=A0A1W1XT32_9NEIS|nr:VOC family protein [Andreprevotia lacus]SMC27024.1 PhnB protein [Andreprevotia lacus DSM 23236]
MQVQSYLFFSNGQCEEALAFYGKVLGAKTTFLTRYGDVPPGTPVEPGQENKVMHCNFTIGDTQIMASDNCAAPGAGMNGFALSLAPATVEEGKVIFDALADGGQVNMPYQPTFWADGFGMLVDRFGVHWMINVAKPM